MSTPEPRFRTARRTTAVLLYSVTAVLTALALLGIARVALWLVTTIWTGIAAP